MWVNKELFQRILDDNKEQSQELQRRVGEFEHVMATAVELKTQQAKDIISIDWLRNRVNALEKQNAILMGKATGLLFPTPEIVPTRPGTIGGVPDFDMLPSYEDMGDAEAKRRGVSLDDDGFIQYTK